MELIRREKITKGTFAGKPFVYNPTTFEDSTTITYNESKSAGMSYPVPIYGGAEMRKISFTLYLNDAAEGMTTQKFISHLRNYVPSERKKGFQFKAPKRVRFSFGWFVKDTVLSEINIRYLAFSPDLRPIEAEVDITLTLII